MTKKLIFKGDPVLTPDPTIKASDTEVIDAAGLIPPPGLVDSHRHAWQAALRSLAANCTLGQCFGDREARTAASFAAEGLYIGR
jgi:cytosine/adenosine deaminase-related metal-dependent hydrolase